MPDATPRPKPGPSRCPTCDRDIIRRRDLSIIPHQRWAKGAGLGLEQPRTFTACEGDPKHPSHTLTLYRNGEPRS